jgi:hypothetical protein
VPLWLRHHPPALPLTGWAPGSLLSRSSDPTYVASEILSWASAPLQSYPNARRCAVSRLPGSSTSDGSRQTPHAAPSLRFFTHSALPRLGHRLIGWDRYFPTASVFRFSQPPDAFFRPKPVGLISCQIRPWVRPSKPSSPRAAVHCSQCLSPLDVSTSSGFFSARRSAFQPSCLG